MMTEDDNSTNPTRVIGGVDTHKDVHVAAVLDELGRLLATASFPTTTAGYRELHRWLCSQVKCSRWASKAPVRGVQGLSRYLRARGMNVDRGEPTEPSDPTPQRQVRHGRRGEWQRGGAGRRRDSHPQGG